MSGRSATRLGDHPRSIRLAVGLIASGRGSRRGRAWGGVAIMPGMIGGETAAMSRMDTLVSIARGPRSTLRNFRRVCTIDDRSAKPFQIRWACP